MNYASAVKQLGLLGAGFGAGALMAQGLAPVSALWAAPVGLLYLAVLFSLTERPARAGQLGWVFGLGYFSVGLSWIMEPFQVDAAAYGWMAPFALVGLAGGLALFWAVAFWAAARLGVRQGRILALIVTWSLAELARAYVLTGFPWAGFAQLALPGDLALRLVPFVGAHGVGVLMLAAVLPLACLRWRPHLLLVSVASVGLAGGLSLVPRGEVAGGSAVVRIVQPNAPQAEKWLPEKRWVFFQRLLDFSAEPTAEDGRPELVVWPETAVPTLQNYIDELTSVMLSSLHGAELLYGIQREENGRYMNSAVVMSAEGEALDTYDKVHLVPFGEYMPLPALWERFGVFGLAARANAGYAPGMERRLMETPVGRALPLICYEGVFAQDVNATAARADYIVLITNDGWFGTQSGPYQHLVQAQLRAAEQGLPMLRAANTGISAVIDAKGQILDQLPLGEAGFIDAALPGALPPTLYSRTGDWPVLVLALLGLLLSIAARLRRNSARTLA